MTAVKVPLLLSPEVSVQAELASISIEPVFFNFGVGSSSNLIPDGLSSKVIERVIFSELLPMDTNETLEVKPENIGGVLSAGIDDPDDPDDVDDPPPPPQLTINNKTK